MARLLLVEDNGELARTVQVWLQEDNHTVDVVVDAESAEALVEQCEFDLLILDWKLPGRSGLEFCKVMRAAGKSMPILMLTGKGDIGDKVAGFDSGADDYLTKPFLTPELLARVRALLKRPRMFAGNVLKVGDLSLDVGQRTVSVSGKEILLPRQEFSLLEYMMRHVDQVVSANSIMNGAWQADVDVGPDALYTCIARLRKKLKSMGSEAFQTVPGQGYMMKSKP